ncbi:hypothetical protein [Kitasatospora sp. MAP5-34]|uniref:hypothetical protein n=1 Tax=Kitasatospora sp. MAP5-34 TaxID=3035102 RepID=UPI002473E544|nr:hypothetical protein [Kitasatospora sp. MAP5-34]MDH6580712.1 hypothetical protein [Kitasatospora sp. MAP5-34]
MTVLNRLVGSALAAGALLLSGVTPASAQAPTAPKAVSTPSSAVYSGSSTYEYNDGVAFQDASANAYRTAVAAGFAPSNCRQSGEQDMAVRPFQWTMWLSTVEVQCTTTSIPGTVDLVRYVSSMDHLSTTVAAPFGYTREFSLGHLDNSQAAGTIPLYTCSYQGTSFTSANVHCEGQPVFVQFLGYAYFTPPAGVSTRPLMRCTYNSQHFDSNDPNCEGQHIDGVLGYTLN